MTDKPDDRTWQEYVFGVDEYENISEKNAEFAKEIVGQVQTAVRESGVLDATRLDVGAYPENGRVDVEADGWEMDKEDVVRVRNALREADIGDETVAVVCHSRPPGEEGPGRKPDSVARGVQVRLWECIKRGDELVAEITGELNAAMAESGGY